MEYKISIKDLQTIVNYLVLRPFGEVAELISMVQKLEKIDPPKIEGV